MGLCSNREGFGPHSSIHPSVPTTCFDDVILIPLATWLYLATLVAGFIARVLVPSRRKKTTRQKDVMTYIYLFLLVCMIAMLSLQLARLSKAELGVGLLWFTYLGVIAAGAVKWFVDGIAVRGLTAVYWLLLAIMMGVEVAGLVDEEGPQYNRVGTQHNYPLGDEVTDMSVMIGVAVVLMVLDVIEVFEARH